MLRAPMVDGIGYNVDSGHIVSVDNHNWGERNMKLMKKLVDPATVNDGMGNSRYSAAALDLETVVCRLEDDETKLLPR